MGGLTLQLAGQLGANVEQLRTRVQEKAQSIRHMKDEMTKERAKFHLRWFPHSSIHSARRTGISGSEKRVVGKGVFAFKT